MKETTAIFNEEKDGYTPTAPGNYNAHIIELRARELDDRVVFNFKVRLSEECAKLDIPKYSKDGDADEPQIVKDDIGKAVMIKADYMVGREFESRGIWFTPVPAPKERWKNRDYLIFCERIGVKWPLNEKGETLLGEIEESDVLGLPLLAKIGPYEYKNKKTKKVTKQIKVLNAYSWYDGKRLKPEELEDEAPF